MTAIASCHFGKRLCTAIASTTLLQHCWLAAWTILCELKLSYAIELSEAGGGKASSFEVNQSARLELPMILLGVLVKQDVFSL